MHDVFISYCSEDKRIADGVVHWLEDNGIRCWIAPRDLHGGSNYSAAIISAIGGCNVLVLVLTDGANRSAPVASEVEQAVRQGVPIIPFRVEDIEPSADIMLHIGSIHWLDAMTPPLEAHLDKLTIAVSHFVGVTGDSPGVKNAAGTARPHAGSGTERTEETPRGGGRAGAGGRRAWRSIAGAVVVLLAAGLIWNITGSTVPSTKGPAREDTNNATPGEDDPERNAQGSTDPSAPSAAASVAPPLAHIQVIDSGPGGPWIVRGATLNDREHEGVLSRVALRTDAPRVIDELVVDPDRVRTVVLDALAARGIEGVRVLVRRGQNWGPAYLDIRAPKSAREELERVVADHVLDTGDARITYMP